MIAATPRAADPLLLPQKGSGEDATGGSVGLHPAVPAAAAG
jgi:hypothetical protein